MFSCFVFLINAAKLQNNFQKTKYTDIFLTLPLKVILMFKHKTNAKTLRHRD